MQGKDAERVGASEVCEGAAGTGFALVKVWCSLRHGAEQLEAMLTAARRGGGNLDEGLHGAQGESAMR